MPEKSGVPGPSDRHEGWYLETPAEGGRLHRVAIHSLPFRVGRGPGLHLTLPADSVSKRHAEIYGTDHGLRLRDLGSKNGTFVDRTPIEDAPIYEGAIVHFADFEFRVGRSDVLDRSDTDTQQTTVVPRTRELPHGFPGRTRELQDLLREGQVSVVFQPIVHLPHGTVAAYEALGRGRHPELPESPTELFRIAESIGREAELSRLFRRKAIELIASRTDLPTIFLNTHPIELDRPGLLESLDELRAIAPQIGLALEIHEKVFTRPSETHDRFLQRIKEVRELLLERNVALAYDDFGAGYNRLLQLAEAPPHYLKFDQRLVQGLDRATSAKRRFVDSLVSLANDLHVKSVAEGIETLGEWRACAEIGFTHVQGFQVGRPRAVEQI